MLITSLSWAMYVMCACLCSSLENLISENQQQIKISVSRLYALTLPHIHEYNNTSSKRQNKYKHKSVDKMVENNLLNNKKITAKYFAVCVHLSHYIDSIGFLRIRLLLHRLALDCFDCHVNFSFLLLSQLFNVITLFVNRKKMFLFGKRSFYHAFFFFV